ncbi:hypothetical protein [Rufibacter roseus]|uniref:Uncharacterized protein n=1 Tax=Rufibacter roseus TaxID=1567108 RepID=A0ABW2DT07_9BACT|nr:hypothetical protein [Rufibacter roseus]
MKNYFLIAAGVLLFTFAFVLGGLVHSPRSSSQAETNIVAQYGPIKWDANAQGQETATRAAQETTVKVVAKQDSKLGEAVKREGKRTRSATYLAMETAGTVKPTPPDLEPGDSTPVTSYAFNDEWIQAQLNLAGNTPTLDYRVRNELEIFQVNTRTGFFTPDRLEVKIKNLNPNSTVLDVQSFAVEVPRKRTGLWLGLGFAAGATTAAYLLN